MDERLERISRLNYWQGNHFEKGIERKLYLDRIMPFTGNRVIKVMTGQRRAGKSWLMRQIVTELLDRGMAKAVVNSELQKLVRLLHGLALLDENVNPWSKFFRSYNEFYPC